MHIIVSYDIFIRFQQKQSILTIKCYTTKHLWLYLLQEAKTGALKILGDQVRQNPNQMVYESSKVIDLLRTGNYAFPFVSLLFKNDWEALNLTSVSRFSILAWCFSWVAPATCLLLTNLNWTGNVDF